MIVIKTQHDYRQALILLELLESDPEDIEFVKAHLIEAIDAYRDTQ